MVAQKSAGRTEIQEGGERKGCGNACKGCVECNVLWELTLFHVLEGRFLEGQGVSL